MRKFKDLMEVPDTIVFGFGRFNPPTIGHEKLVNAVAKQQSKNAGSKMYVYASHSNDPQKNPLAYAKKIAYMRKMFKKYSKNIITGKPKTAIEVAVELYNKGHKAIVMVVGSDRVAEFDALLKKYNGVNIDLIELDKEMFRWSQTEPYITTLNDNAFDDFAEVDMNEYAEARHALRTIPLTNVGNRVFFIFFLYRSYKFVA